MGVPGSKTDKEKYIRPSFIKNHIMDSKNNYKLIAASDLIK
jgi:penicillin V acylase-like amidase (Ntn superfamily)